ncbi:MAG: M23 family metallopeptidase [Bacteroidia bacterium]|nr:M23 family metallopeptidase [Bacteroidia bacterium]
MFGFINRFEWDDRTLTFRRAPLRVWQLVRRLPGPLVRGFFTGAVLVGLTYGWWERYFLHLEDKRVRRLQVEYQRISQEVVQYEQRMQRLHERAEKLYRPVLGLSPLSSSQWEGNMGGAPISSIEHSLYRGKLLHQEYTKLEELLAEQASHLAHLPCIAPVSGIRVSGFGFRRDPFHGAWQMHTGIDISAPYGSPVRAAASGRVQIAGWDGGGYGLQVEVDHGNGLVTKYAHLSRLAVQVGEEVRRGQVIGYVGSTGYSVAPHLHYEVIERGVKVNPEKYLLLH